MRPRNMAELIWEEASEKSNVDACQCEASDSKAQLIALCEGLELEEIDDLLTMPPDYFEIIGKVLALKIKKCECGAL